jgi:hypothetical protein
MRGEDTPADKLYYFAAQADRVLVTDYLPGGRLRLRAVGSIHASPSASSSIATFGDAAQLISGTLKASDDLEVTLIWRDLKPLHEGDTIFVHVWQDGQFVQAYDGDSLGGLIPLTVWQANADIIDVRHLPLPSPDPMRYEVRVGLYNRNDGGRYPAYDPFGVQLPDDAVPIAAAKPR